MQPKVHNERPTPLLGKIERQSMHDQVYAELKTALMEARFTPGSQLSLRALAEIFGVSVMPVRAALLRLVAERAVVQQSTTTGNFFVPELSRKEFEEIVQLRALLEGLAAEQAATRITPSQLDALDGLARKLQQAAERNRANEYLKANRDFKFGVIAAADAPVLRELIESLWIRMGPLMHLYARDMKQQGDTDRYYEVLEALRLGDAEVAREQMQQDTIDGAAFLRAAAGFSSQVDPETFAKRESSPQPAR